MPRWISATPRTRILPGCPPPSPRRRPANPAAFHSATHRVTVDLAPLAAKVAPFYPAPESPLEVPETVVRAAEEYGCPTPSKVLSADELEGREALDPTPDAVAALDWVWSKIVLAGMDDGKAKPPIRCFRKVMDGGVVTQGFLRDGTVFINEDLAHGASVELRQTVLEEVAHYLTGSKDCTRDLQDWAFKLAVRLAMATPVERSAAA
jgi:hypothetical protein